MVSWIIFICFHLLCLNIFHREKTLFNLSVGIANLSLIPIELKTYYFDSCTYDEGNENSALFYRRICWWTQPDLEKRSPEYIKVLFDQASVYQNTSFIKALIKPKMKGGVITYGLLGSGAVSLGLLDFNRWWSAWWKAIRKNRISLINKLNILKGTFY